MTHRIYIGNHDCPFVDVVIRERDWTFERFVTQELKKGAVKIFADSPIQLRSFLNFISPFWDAHDEILSWSTFCHETGESRMLGKGRMDEGTLDGILYDAIRRSIEIATAIRDAARGVRHA